MSAFLVTAFLLLGIFVVVTFAGHSVHWAIHQKWAGKLHTAHMTHHEILYPPSDFLSDAYRSAGKDNTVFTFLVFSIPFFAVPILLYVYGVIPLIALVLALIEIVFVGWLHDYFHDSFHIRKHFMKRYAFFRHLTDVHYVHHVDMQKNFGIFLFWWDKAFSSFKQA